MDSHQYALHHLISGINFLSYSVSLNKVILLMMSLSNSPRPLSRHFHHPSRIYCFSFSPGSKLSFFAQSFPSLSASTHRTASTHHIYRTGHILLNGLQFTRLSFFSYSSFLFWVVRYSERETGTGKFGLIDGRAVSQQQLRNL